MSEDNISGADGARLFREGYESGVRDSAEKCREMREAAAALNVKLNEITNSDEYKAVFFCAHNHGQPYKGETFTDEYVALMEAVKSFDALLSEPKGETGE